MTIALARTFGDRIVMMSDSMLSGRELPEPDIIPGQPKPYVIPGQLKSIVLNQSVSVSFAGPNATGALYVLRDAKEQLDGGTSFDTVLGNLAEASKEGWDFIVATHLPSASLYRVSGGRIASGSDRYWIGDPEVADAVQRLTEEMPPWPDTEVATGEENRFTAACFRTIYETRSSVVGGFAFCCLASPFGHCYLNFAMGHYWDFVRLGEAGTPARLQFEQTGTTAHKYTTVSPVERGVAVVGALLPYADIGFIYSPLEFDQPLRRHPTTLDELGTEVRQVAARLAAAAGGSA